MRQFSLLLLLLAMTSMFHSCSVNVAGGATSETTNGLVTATVYHPDGSTASECMTLLMPVDYDPVKNEKLPENLVKTTDENGSCTFQVFESGNFNLYAAYDGTRLFQAGITVKENNITVTDTLQELGAAIIELADTVDTLTSYLYIPGTNMYQKLAGENMLHINNIFRVIFDSIPTATIPGIYFGKKDLVFNSIPLTDALTIAPHDTLNLTTTQVLWSTITKANSELPDNGVSAMMVDNAGKIWVGTAEGLATFDGKAWELFNMQTSDIPGNSIQTIAQGPDGTVWVCTAEGIVNIKNGIWTIYTTVSTNLSFHSMHAVAIDSSGHVWFGAPEGCVEFDGAQLWTPHDVTFNGMPIMFVNALAVDKDGVVLVGTDNGVYTHDGFEWNQVSLAENNPLYGEIHDITVGPDNTWWFTTDGGLASFHEDSSILYDNTIIGVMDPRLKSLAIDWNNIVWTGFYTTGNILKFSSPVVLYNQSNTDVLKGITQINDIVIGNDKSIYFATEYNGIVTVRFSSIFNN